MSTRKSADKYSALKSLLASWNLDELFEHLKDEEINIEELEMMKSNHLSELLSNFKLGIRIRFEHNFEKWRHSIYKPLEKQCKNNSNNSNDSNASIKPIEAAQKSTSNNNNDVTTVQKESSENRIPALYLPSPKRSANETESTISKQALYRKVSDCNEIGDSEITVPKILESFGHLGVSLLDSYKENQTFTNAQRHLLLKLIVNYFEINDYHLSLNTSYILEKQIVKYFPNEKIEHYRTEKRGKIYSKYSNMKRKRAESMAASKDQGSTIRYKRARIQESPLNEQECSIINNNDYNDQEVDLCEDSNEQEYSDLPIKIEYAIN